MIDYQSFKCKSKAKAIEIVNKRPNAISWDFYEKDERIYNQKKKLVEDVNYDEEYYRKLMIQQCLIK